MTRLRQAEAELRESRALLEIATGAADLGIWDWNLQTGEMLYSERVNGIHGFAPSQPVTLGMIKPATHPDDLPRTSAMAERALDPAVREHAAYEYRIIRTCDEACAGCSRMVRQSTLRTRHGALYVVAHVLTDRAGGCLQADSHQWLYRIKEGDLVDVPEVSYALKRCRPPEPIPYWCEYSN